MVQRLGYYGQGLGRVMSVHSGGVHRFEDLLAWRKARDLTREVYEVTRGRDFRRDFALRDQIRRAAVSIMSNIAEGFERARRAEFHSFFRLRRAPVLKFARNCTLRSTPVTWISVTSTGSWR